MQRKYLVFFFIYSYSFKKRKREGQYIQSSLKGCKEKRLFKGHHFFLMESTRKRTPFQSKMVYKWIMGSFLGQ